MDAENPQSYGLCKYIIATHGSYTMHIEPDRVNIFKNVQEIDRTIEEPNVLRMQKRIPGISIDNKYNYIT